ncbi:hypothetical protein K504DRAFT_352354, partial [Pleomassaria siparia CBS 279.74]
ATEPCAEVSTYLAGSKRLPAKTAWGCLQSVPVDVEGNKKLIDELKLAWAWNSEYVYLKNTPKDWEYGSIDIESELDKIKNGLGDFKSEYDVQRAIQAITYKTGNYHFNYVPDILQVFHWRRDIGVMQLSTDGKSLPKLYRDTDIYSLARGSVRASASEITKINDEDAYTYLAKIGAWGQYIDSDGRLNKLFTKSDSQSQGTFESQVHYEGPTTKLTFANGNETTYDNFVGTTFDFDDVTDGASFFQAFCTGTSSIIGHSPADNSPGRYSDPVQPPKKDMPSLDVVKRQLRGNTGYEMVVQDERGAVTGYFLNGDGYEDVAVLKVFTFSGMEFQATMKTFLEQCIAQKKQKLIIDLRENGGGSPSLFLDMFMQLFPEQVPFSAQRYRAEEQWVAIGETVSEIWNTPKWAASFERTRGIELNNNWRYWAYWHFVTVKGENFKDWNEFVGPFEFNGDNYTATSRYNMSNDDRTSIRVPGFYFINGTRPTPFDAKNIVMFTDALCGSACAGIHEELKNIAGVRSVTVGGRPKSGPMQAVTGSKGGEVRPIFSFPSYAKSIFSVVTYYSVKTPSSTKLAQIANATQLQMRAGDQHSRIQTQDKLRKGDTTATPLEFIYDAADCRIFYTAQSYVDSAAAYKQVWDAFTDDTKCVEGSTKHKSSINGGFVPFGPGERRGQN